MTEEKDGLIDSLDKAEAEIKSLVESIYKCSK